MASLAAQTASQLLRDIAQSVVVIKGNPVLQVNAAESLVGRCPKGKIRTIMQEILQLLRQYNRIFHNKFLGLKLQILASSMSQDIAIANKSVAETIQCHFQQKHWCHQPFQIVTNSPSTFATSEASTALYVYGILGRSSPKSPVCP